MNLKSTEVQYDKMRVHRKGKEWNKFKLKKRKRKKK